jgi:MscS family membrane protein
VVCVGVIFVLQNMDVDVGSLLAGASLGGLAFTLAARDTVANLFGSISIFADHPFQVGDWVVIDGHEGVVEEVGMRSTRIRTFYSSVVTIPNSVVANTAVDNYGMRQYRRCMVTLGVTYDTTPELMRAFVEGIRAILRANPKVRKDAYEVCFRNFNASGLEILVYFFFDTDTWSDELAQRQNVFLEVLRLAEQLGVRFAFPTQTLHIESQSTREPRTPTRQLDEATLAQVVRSFGPGGSASRPEPTHLTDGYLPGASQRGSTEAHN